MIVDCHTQIWDSNARLGHGDCALVTGTVHADAERHLQAALPVDRAIVLGFKSRYLGAEIPNSYVADYVRRNPAKMVGFAGIDPTEPAWLEELRIAQDELQLKGVAISPASQDFHPSDTRAMRLYEQCLQRSLPVVFEQNRRSPAAKLELDQPLLFDEVAREFPDLRIVVAHMGYPWVHETVTLLGKHPHVFADVAGLLRHPWLAYNALLAAYEYGVMDKLLFGSGFPFRSPAGAIETLYSVNQISYGTNLIAIPREQLRGIVERDALGLLGIEQQLARAPRAGTIVEDE